MLKVNLPLQHLLAVLDTSHTSTLPTLSLLQLIFHSVILSTLNTIFLHTHFPLSQYPTPPLNFALFIFTIFSLHSLPPNFFFLPLHSPHSHSPYLSHPLTARFLPTHSTLFRLILSLLTHTLYQFSFSPFSLLPTLFLSTFTPPTFTLLFLINLIHTTDTPSTLTLPTHILITLTLPISSFSQVSKC